MKPAKNTICLWYDRDAEAAARFYAEDIPRFVGDRGAPRTGGLSHRGSRGTC